MPAVSPCGLRKRTARGLYLHHYRMRMVADWRDLTGGSSLRKRLARAVPESPILAAEPSPASTRASLCCVSCGPAIIPTLTRRSLQC
jgi:hypothetical protein